MAQYTGAFSSGWATLIINVSESGTSAETNKGTISWSIYVRKDKSCQSYNNGGASISLKIGGTGRYSGDAFDIRSLSVGSSKKIASGSFIATHDSEGKLSLSVVASFASGVGLGSASISKTFTGTTIPRASSISSITETVTAGNAVAIAISRKNSSFTHTVNIAIGSYSVTLEDVGTSISYTVPIEWINAITAATTGNATVTMTTYSGDTKIGSAVSDTFVIAVPDTVEYYPVITDVDIAEAVASVTSAFGSRFVQGLSQLNVTIDAEGVYGSTIKGYSTKLDGVTYIQQAFTSNVIGNAGSLAVEVVVTDSRGRTATKKVTLNVVEYQKPVITKIEYIHCDSNGKQDSGGKYTKVTVTGKVYPVANQNTKALKLLYKSVDDEAYTERVVNISSLGWEFTADTIISGTDPSVTFEYIAELTDKLYGDSAGVTTGIVCMSRLAGGKGIALFGEAEEEGFVINGDNPLKIKSDLAKAGTRQNINLIGVNPIASIEEDTPANWAALGTGVAYINVDGLLNNQPTLYGLIENRVYKSLVSQTFYSMNGKSPVWHRSGNASGWDTDSANWVKSLDENSMADYIVEEGTSGIFNYRKWNSGKMEVWGEWSGTLKNYATVSPFYAYYTSISLPAVCQFTARPQLNYNAQVGSGFALAGSATMGISGTIFTCYALATASGSQSVCFSFNLKGKWK